MKKYKYLSILKLTPAIFLLEVFLVSCGNNNRKRSNTATPQVKQQQNKKLSAVDLRNAAFNDKLSPVKKAVNQGVDLNKSDGQGRTALMLAAYNGHAKIVKFLCSHGADVDLVNADGRTALIFASSGPFPETVKILLSSGADPDIRDKKEHWTALMFASAEGNKKVVKVLIDHGADITPKDIDGDRAVDFAKNNGHDEVVQLLKKAEEG